MILLLASLFVLLVIGVPIAYSLGFSALLYFLVERPSLLLVLPQRVFSGLDSYAMIALPLFCLMGLLMNESGITNRLINFLMVFVGRLPGGLALVNVLDSMVFGGISGSSVADVASLGTVMIPAMEQKGYPKEFASGITVATATMGMMIPPSIPMVIYAFVSQESVGKLFLAGAVPGVLVGILMFVLTIGISARRKYPVEAPGLTLREAGKRVVSALPAVLMPVFVVGAVVLGITTATESAGVGVLYALVVGVFLYRGLKLRAIPRILIQAVRMSAAVMMIIGFSQLYVWILAIEKVPQMVTSFIAGLDLPVFVILLIVDLVILAIGTFVDVGPAIILLCPILLPAMKAIGVSPIQFGAIMITGMAVGLVTPPVGMCLNVASVISGINIFRIFRGALPFIIMNVIVLVMITLVPWFSLWLPNLLMGS